MANLALTFKDLYEKVQKYLGTYGSTGATGAELTSSKEIVNDGYRRFINSRKWSFLFPIEQITTMNGQHTYELPQDFVSLQGSITFGADERYSDLKPITMPKWNSLRASNDYTGYPEFYVIHPEKFDKDMGTRWNLHIYPTPDASYCLQLPIQIMPLKLENDNDLPIGGPEMSDALRVVCLAEAEDAKEGVKEPIYKPQVSSVLNNAFALDRRRYSRSVGHLGGSDIDSRFLWREIRFNDVTFTE